MDSFEKKYGFEEDEKTKTFHRKRRMFCIYQNKLYIARPNLPYSHAVWFEKEGWISRENDKLMGEIIRGIIDKNGDIYFYSGYDFEVNKRIETVLFSHLKELAEKLKLKASAKVFGGLVKQEAEKTWPPRKEYGTIIDNL